MALISPMPFAKAVLGGLTAVIGNDWRNWFQQIKDAIDRASQRVGSSVSATTQAASIPTTALPTGVLQAGLYRVSWLLRITQAATTSSSAQVTIGSTVAGLPTSQSGAALTSNTVGAVQTGSVLVAADVASAITYAVAYASVGATPMQYALSVLVEGLPT